MENDSSAPEIHGESTCPLLDEQPPRGKGLGLCSVRWGLAIILHVSLFITYSQRVDLSIAIVAMGVIFPAVYTLWTKWAPPQELTCLMNFADAGTTLGTFFTLMVGGITCQTLGWPSFFYIFGGVNCVWCLLWFFLVFEDPDSHPCLSTTEKEYIASASTQKGPCHSWSLPLLSMLKFGPLWAIAVAYFCCDWLLYTLLTLLPVYLNRILHLDTGESGFLSAPPHIGNWLGHIGTGLLGDFLVAKSLLHLGTTRTLFTALGMLCSAALVLEVSYIGCNYIAAVILFTVSMTLISMTGAGYAVNLLDVAPRYSGFLHRVINTLANLSGMVAPSVAGFLSSQDTLSGWRNVFFLSGAINLCGVVFYLIFGRADIQDWARVDSTP